MATDISQPVAAIMADLISNASSLVTRAAAADSLNTQLAADKAAAQGQVASLASDKAGLLATTSAQAITISGLRSQVADLQAEITSLQGQTGGSTPTPAPAATPAPSFTVQPSIAGTPQIGHTFTGMDGTISHGTVVSRRWLLGAAVVSTAQTYLASVAGALVYEVTAQGPGGTTVASSAAVTVAAAAASGSVTRITYSNALTRGQPVPANTVLLNRADPSSTFAIADAGLVIDNATGAVTGTPNERCALVKETLPNGTVRNNLLFTPDRGTRRAGNGINLAQFNYISDNIMLLDYLKTAQVVVAPGSVTANGVPQSIAAGQSEIRYRVCLDDGRTTPVRYRLISDANLGCQLVCEGFTNYLNFDIDANGNVGCTYTGPSSKQSQACEFLIKAFDPNKLPTYIHLVREDEAALFLTGTTRGFKQTFITRMQQFAAIRMMNLASANQFDELPLTRDSFTYVLSTAYDGHPAGFYSALPLEVQADLCIVAMVAGWFNVHHKTTDAQFQAMWAHYDRVKAAGLTVNLEYSNETWDSIFAQYQYCIDQFATLPDPKPVEADGSAYNETYKGVYWAGYRMAQLARLCKGRGYKFQVGVQPVYQNDLTFGPIPHFDKGMAAGNGGSTSDLKALYADCAGWTVTTYTGGDWTPDPTYVGQARVDQFAAIAAANDVDSLMDIIANAPGGAHSISIKSLPDFLAQGKVNANNRGLELNAYEGNHYGVQSLAGGHLAFNDFLLTAADHELNRPMALANMEQADASGLTLVMEFDYGSGEPNAQFGVFGIYSRPTELGIAEFNAKPLASSSASAPTPTPNPTPATKGKRYLILKIYGLTNNSPSEAPALSDVHFLKADGTEYDRSVITASGDHYGSFSPQNTIDGDASTFYDGRGGQANVLVYDFGAGNTAKPASITMSQQGGGFEGDAPADFEWFSSDDGVVGTSVYRTQQVNGTGPGNARYDPQTHAIAYNPPAGVFTCVLTYPA